MPDTPDSARKDEQPKKPLTPNAETIEAMKAARQFGRRCLRAART